MLIMGTSNRYLSSNSLYYYCLYFSILWVWGTDPLVGVGTPVVLLHICPFNLTLPIVKYGTVTSSYAQWKDSKFGFWLWLHHAQEKSNKLSSSFAAFCQTTVWLLVNRESSSTTTHTLAQHSGQSSTPTLSLFLFLPMMSTARITQRLHKDLPAVSSSLSLLWVTFLSVSLLPHVTSPGHGQ